MSIIEEFTTCQGYNISYCLFTYMNLSWGITAIIAVILAWYFTRGDYIKKARETETLIVGYKRQNDLQAQKIKELLNRKEGKG